MQTKKTAAWRNSFVCSAKTTRKKHVKKKNRDKPSTWINCLTAYIRILLTVKDHLLKSFISLCIYKASLIRMVRTFQVWYRCQTIYMYNDPFCSLRSFLNFFLITLAPVVQTLDSAIHQGPVARSLVSANRWLRGIKMYRFPWCLTLVSTNMLRATRAR